ncbi:hypothetical protein [Jannaschia sp. W003]|uniref:hypothetical protein n=1 Tax=Jannaschia sp. W003 TaxID=2867012 RepID=UPI0021A6B295|nr:hypothetical protein [Jannaschia sp. W003]UWQ21905.1 hypothetical protein K3554_02425 [Jannaschia sp. W003]
MRPRRPGPPLLLAAVAAALLLALAPVARGQTAGPAVEPSFAAALVRDALAAVNHANWTGNYTVLRDYADRGFAEANDPTRLAALFEPLRRAHLDLRRTLVVAPVMLRAELGEGRRMQLTGYFPLEPEHVSFDLLFREEAGRWWLLGASVGTFPPIAPADAAGAARD